MNPLLRLEVFDDATDAPSTTVLSSAALDAIRRAALEQGRADAEEQATARHLRATEVFQAELVEAVKRLTLTQNQARQHVLHALQPLLCDVLIRVLPQAVHSCLGQIVAETLMPLARDMVRAPIRIALHPANRPVVEGWVEGPGDHSIVFVDDAELTPGQIILRVAETETQIDTEATVASVITAIQSFTTLNLEGTTHDLSR